MRYVAFGLDVTKKEEEKRKKTRQFLSRGFNQLPAEVETRTLTPLQPE